MGWWNGNKHGSRRDFNSLIRHCLAIGFCRFEIECGPINGSVRARARAFLFQNNWNQRKQKKVSRWRVVNRFAAEWGMARRFAHEPIEAMFVPQWNDENMMWSCARNMFLIGVRSPTQTFHSRISNESMLNSKLEREKKNAHTHSDRCHLLVSKWRINEQITHKLIFKYLTRRTTHHQVAVFRCN